MIQPRHFLIALICLLPIPANAADVETPLEARESCAAGEKWGARIYNWFHTYTHPAILAAIGWFAGVPLLIELGLIWAAHIGMDRALGYGLKYPGLAGQTHIGPMGKAAKLANAG